MTLLPKNIRIDINVLEDVLAVKKWMERKSGEEVSYSNAIREIIQIACERDEELSVRLKNRGRLIDPEQTRLVLLPKEGTK